MRAEIATCTQEIERRKARKSQERAPPIRKPGVPVGNNSGDLRVALGVKEVSGISYRQVRSLFGVGLKR